MALVKLSSYISEIRGRVGNVYFKRDHFGQHLQAMPRMTRKISYEMPVIQPHSPGGSRAAYVNAWTNVAKAYAFLITITYVPLWIAYMNSNYYKTKKGTVTKLSPWQWLTHYNITRAARQLPLWWRPPRNPQHLPELSMVGNYYKILYPGGQPTQQNDTLLMYKSAKYNTYNGKQWYSSDIRYKTLWWDGESWIISGGLGEYGPTWWYLDNPDEIGIYLPHNPADGTMQINY